MANIKVTSIDLKLTNIDDDYTLPSHTRSNKSVLALDKRTTNVKNIPKKSHPKNDTINKTVV